jgi:hypothetical protein
MAAASIGTMRRVANSGDADQHPSASDLVEEAHRRRDGQHAAHQVGHVAPRMADRSGAGPVPTLGIALTAMNSMRTLEATLRSVVGLGAIVLVVDSGSTDGSKELARQLGAIVEERPWAGHVAQKQYALDRCVALRPELEWLLLLDSDEAVDATLAAAIRSALGASQTSAATPSAGLTGAGPVGWDIQRPLILHGRTLRRTFQPEWRLRLVRVGRFRVAGTPPHDRLAVDGPIGRLDGLLLHDSWANAIDMLRRSEGYAAIAAAQEARGGRLLDIAVRPTAAFLKQYILRRGYQDGWRGLVAAGGAAAATLMKHIAIAERDGLRRESGSAARAHR